MWSGDKMAHVRLFGRRRFLSLSFFLSFIFYPFPSLKRTNIFKKRIRRARPLHWHDHHTQRERAVTRRLFHISSLSSRTCSLKNSSRWSGGYCAFSLSLSPFSPPHHHPKDLRFLIQDEAVAPPKQLQEKEKSPNAHRQPRFKSKTPLAGSISN